jgi:hypothetical protein
MAHSELRVPQFWNVPPEVHPAIGWRTSFVVVCNCGCGIVAFQRICRGIYPQFPIAIGSRVNATLVAPPICLDFISLSSAKSGRRKARTQVPLPLAAGSSVQPGTRVKSCARARLQQVRADTMRAWASARSATHAGSVLLLPVLVEPDADLCVPVALACGGRHALACGAG